MSETVCFLKIYPAHPGLRVLSQDSGPRSPTLLGELRQFGCEPTSRCLSGGILSSRGHGQWEDRASFGPVPHLDSFPSSELIFFASSP